MIGFSPAKLLGISCDFADGRVEVLNLRTRWTDATEMLFLKPISVTDATELTRSFVKRHLATARENSEF
jgi:hypothetical protein